MNRILKIAILYSIVLAIIDQQASALSVKKENDSSNELENYSFEKSSENLKDDIVTPVSIKSKRSKDDSNDKKSRWEEFITLFSEFMEYLHRKNMKTEYSPEYSIRRQKDF
ncbi:hypothetical protein BpHYR1_052834 [Brachionus plicatilis]|uniref:Uncharacterized protein n=1 Tax=Brachionus plicatilis TaxID=10195 RepID=A0A3M7RIX8_BRAPC|nr:hypothetical protein BpHYR1_052834 [Brachionus plicatilis]